MSDHGCNLERAQVLFLSENRDVNTQKRRSGHHCGCFSLSSQWFLSVISVIFVGHLSDLITSNKWDDTTFLRGCSVISLVFFMPWIQILCLSPCYLAIYEKFVEIAKIGGKSCVTDKDCKEEAAKMSVYSTIINGRAFIVESEIKKWVMMEINFSSKLARIKEIICRLDISCMSITCAIWFCLSMASPFVIMVQI